MHLHCSSAVCTWSLSIINYCATFIIASFSSRSSCIHLFIMLHDQLSQDHIKHTLIMRQVIQWGSTLPALRLDLRKDR